MYFVPYLYGGRSPPYTYNTKYTGPPRVFDTPSSHSNFNPNSNSNFNSKLKNKKVFLIFHSDRPNTGIDSGDSENTTFFFFFLLPVSLRKMRLETKHRVHT